MRRYCIVSPRNSSGAWFVRVTGTVMSSSMSLTPRYAWQTNTVICCRSYLVPARKPPNFAPKAASYRRCQPEIACASIGHLRPMAEPILRFRAQKAYCARRNGTIRKKNQAARRSRRRSCRCSSMQIQRENRQRDRSAETVISTRTNTVEITLFEVVYRRFNRRMFLLSKFEVLRFFSFRSIRFRFPFRGRALRSRISSSSNRLEGL